MKQKKKRMEDGILFPQYLNTNERTVEVVGISDGDPKKTTADTPYIESKGYIIDRAITLGKKPKDNNPKPGIWIYCAAKPLHPDTYPYFWKVSEKKDGEWTMRLEFSDPAPLMINAFSMENMHDISIVNIVEKTIPGQPLFNENELRDINASANFYVPIIYERDDFLKKIVKTVIISEGININKLKSKTNEKYQIPNMVAALRNSTKMSVVYFSYWMELLNCNFSIKVSDDGRPHADKLNDAVVYDSDSGVIEEEDENGKRTPLDPAKYHTVKEEDSE